MRDCQHCGGQLARDEDGDAVCLHCNRLAVVVVCDDVAEDEAEPKPLTAKQDPAAYHRNYYHHRRDNGLCTKHGGDVKAVRQGLCQYHLDKATERQAKRNKRKYDRAVAAGTCTVCYKRAALVGYIHCATCKDYIARKSRAWYERKGGRIKCPCGVWFFRKGAKQIYHAADCPARQKTPST